MGKSYTKHRSKRGSPQSLTITTTTTHLPTENIAKTARKLNQMSQKRQIQAKGMWKTNLIVRRYDIYHIFVHFYFVVG